MATKELVVVYVESVEVWMRYITKVNESYITRAHKAPSVFPAIVLERLIDGWCSTEEAQILTSPSSFEIYADSLTDYHIKDAIKRWNLNGEDDDVYDDLPF
jgi:hypothetical protein